MGKAAYTRESGLNPNTIYSWFKTYESNGPRDRNTIVEIIADGKYKNGETEKSGSMSICITLRNGYNLIVPTRFLTHTLHAVLDVLEGR